MNPAYIEQFHFGETTRIACPYCSEDRKKRGQKDMTLTRRPDGAVLFTCHHCQASGSVQPKKEYRMSAVFEKVTPIHQVPEVQQKPLEERHYSWLQTRGISKATADKMKLFASTKWFAKTSKMDDAIGFPYYKDGNLVAVKYRSFPEKAFTQEAGGAHDFWGIDSIDKTKPLVIVEGEMDYLTLLEIGISNVLSVPAGAPLKVADGKVLPSEDKKFSFVWSANDILEAVPSIILATDQDPAGQALAEELARRIGKEKCKVAKFHSKDFNDILVADPTKARDNIQTIIDNSAAYPIAGLSMATSYEDRLNDLFSKGTGKGFSTGYSSIDEIYTIAPSQLTVVTGHPSSGKSNFVDQIMVNLARSCDWKFAICSFENQPEIHISRLMELYLHKRFFDGQNRMSKEEKEAAFKWVNEHFIFIDNNGDEPPTLDSIIGRAKVAIKRMGVRGLVIDPYNFIELDRSKVGTETEAISAMLTKVQRFIKTFDIHCWFVAHPAKMQRSGTDLPRPDGMSIAGSMAWWAKADCGITIHRGEGCVEFAVWKCRHRWVGTQGETTLLYNKSCGSYSENLDMF